MTGRSCSLPRGSLRAGGGGLGSSLQDVRLNGAGTGAGGYLSRTYPSGGPGGNGSSSRSSRRLTPSLSHSFDQNFFKPIDRQNGMCN